MIRFSFRARMIESHTKDLVWRDYLPHLTRPGATGVKCAMTALLDYKRVFQIIIYRKS